MTKLDPLSLKLFVSVVTDKSIAAAAERHHIAATAVSKRITELEHALDTTLLRRTNRGVIPTEVGLSLCALAQSALNELDRIPILINNFSSGGQGVVRICASTSSTAQFLTDDLISFAKANPGIQLHIEEGTSETVLQNVRDNAADLGVYTNAHDLLDLQTSPYRSDRLVLVCPPAHPLAKRASWRFEETLEHDYIGWFGRSAINKQLNAAALMSQSSCRLRIRVSSFDAMCKMVSEGLGIGILPEAVARQRSKAFALSICELDEPWAGRKFGIAYRDRTALTPSAQLLLEFLESASSQGSFGINDNTATGRPPGGYPAGGSFQNNRQ